MPFKQWGIDIIGEINLNFSILHKYILIALDYFRRSIESLPLCKVNEDTVIEFLQEHIMTMFRLPISLVFYNASYFSSIKMTKLASERGILQDRINTLLKLEESRIKSKEIFKHQQEIVKIWFHFVLKWDHPHDEKGKFQHLWVGPFQIAENIAPST